MLQGQMDCLVRLVEVYVSWCEVRTLMDIKEEKKELMSQIVDSEYLILRSTKTLVWLACPCPTLTSSDTWWTPIKHLLV